MEGWTPICRATSSTVMVGSASMALALHLGRTQCGLSPSPAAHRLGLLQPRVRALKCQLSLELRHGREDVEDEPSSRRGGVDRLGEHLQPDLTPLQVGGGLHQLAHRAGQSIEFPHHESVAGAHVVERALQLGSVAGGARRLLSEHALAAGALKRLQLQCQ